jgi:hypothetical protein
MVIQGTHRRVRTIVSLRNMPLTFISRIRLISIAVILGGSLWYTWLKANPPPSQQHGHQRSESITALPLMRRKDEDTEAGAPSGAPGTYERVPDEDPDREFAREARKD